MEQNNKEQKELQTFYNEIELAEFDDLKLDIEKLRFIEFKNMYLEQLPIFDWYTYNYIDENINLLIQENKDLLIKKFNEVDARLVKEKAKLIEMNRVSKLYKQRVIQHAMEEPATKKYIEKN